MLRMLQPCCQSTLCGISSSKGVEGDLFITYVPVISTSAQNVLDNFACANILRTRSMMVQFILSANQFSYRVFEIVYSSRIPFDRWYSSNYPWYSPLFSSRTAFSFLPDSLSTLMWNTLKTHNTWWGPQFQVVVIYKRHEVLRSNMWLRVYLTHIGMHKFQRCLPSHWWSPLEGGSVLLAG